VSRPKLGSVVARLIRRGTCRSTTKRQSLEENLWLPVHALPLKPLGAKAQALLEFIRQNSQGAAPPSRPRFYLPCLGTASDRNIPCPDQLHESMDRCVRGKTGYLSILPVDSVLSPPQGQASAKTRLIFDADNDSKAGLSRWLHAVASTFCVSRVSRKSAQQKFPLS